MLERCVSSIKSSKLRPVIHIIDNSPDDSLRYPSLSLGCIYEHHPENRGYGAGHNIAIKNSLAQGAQYHLVINPDVWFDQDILTTAVDYLDNNPDVAQIMPKVLNVDGEMQHLCKLVPTPFDLFLRRFLPKKIGLKSRGRFQLLDSGYDKVMFVPFLSGCFMLLRCSTLKEAGIFDERFFMYAEDADLTRRLATSFETQYLPFVAITHMHGAASHKSIRMLLVHISSAIKYFNKWGWFSDTERDRLNKKAASQYKQL